MGPVEQGIKEGSKSHWLASKFAKAGDRLVVEAIQEELNSEDNKVRSAAAKTLSHLAGHCPEWFQDELSSYLTLLNSDQTIMRWAAMDIVGHLVATDSKDQIDESTLQILIAAAADESMVTAAHGIDNLARLGNARPAWHSQILAELFRVETTHRPANCREVLLAKVADALGSLLPDLSEVNRAAVITFLNRLAMNDGRDGKKAAKILQRIS